MRILIAPDKFKGSLSALEAAEAIARGIAQALPNAMTIRMPIADGGEGTAEAICAALGGKWITATVRDPLGRDVTGRYASLDDGVAVIDMSEASGLWRLKSDERNPLRASTFGTGQLMAIAAGNDAKKLIVGLGGSATNDGGIGMAAALGFRFFDGGGALLDPIPVNLPSLARVEAPGQPLGATVTALCDVKNPLCGPRGASATYGPQKGADPATVEQLDRNLAHLADIVHRDLGCDFKETPGSGAAGGLGFGMLSFCRAEMRSGFETLAEILQLEREIAASDLVITGEGRIDSQTLEGKGPAGVAELARKHGKRVIAFGGMVGDAEQVAQVFEHAYAITPTGMPLEQAFREAAALLEKAAADAIRDARHATCA